MIIAVIALAGVLVASFIERLVSQRATAAERSRLLNAVVARHAGELAALGAIDIKPKKPNGKKPERVPNEDEMIGIAGN